MINVRRTNDQPNAQPNVIVFFTDQQRWDTVGAAGNPMGLTPNLDQMCQRGTMFEAACTTNPLCAPARSALQTGLYPATNGVYRNGLTLDGDLPRLGQFFADAGYQTGYIGMWHLNEDNPVPPSNRQGYDFWLASNILEFTSDEYRTIVYDTDGLPIFLPGYRSDALTDAAIRFITERHEEPFMLFLSFTEPHHQNELDNFPSPEVYRGAFQDPWMPPDLATLPGSQQRHLDGYYGQVKRLDECLGRVRDALLSMEIADDTLIAYTSDHGCHFKTRNPEYKRTAHDASVRVPLVLDGPGYRSGGRVAGPVSTIDLPPTLLAAAQIDVPDHMQGRPLSQRGTATDNQILIQISESEVGRALRTTRWKYHVTAPDAGDVAGSDHYVEVGLYDLSVDPYELDNLIGCGNFDEVTVELRQALVGKIAEIEGTDVIIEPTAEQDHRLRYPESIVRQLNLTGRAGEWRR